MDHNAFYESSADKLKSFWLKLLEIMLLRWRAAASLGAAHTAWQALRGSRSCRAHAGLRKRDVGLGAQVWQSPVRGAEVISKLQGTSGASETGRWHRRASLPFACPGVEGLNHIQSPLVESATHRVQPAARDRQGAARPRRRHRRARCPQTLFRIEGLHHGQRLVAVGSAHDVDQAPQRYCSAPPARCRHRGQWDADVANEVPTFRQVRRATAQLHAAKDVHSSIKQRCRVILPVCRVYRHCRQWPQPPSQAHVEALDGVLEPTAKHVQVRTKGHHARVRSAAGRRRQLCPGTRRGVERLDRVQRHQREARGVGAPDYVQAAGHRGGLAAAPRGRHRRQRRPSSRKGTVHFHDRSRPVHVVTADN
mmetsp:Transcript_158124/g.503516  ORF Transcript_158124/g.503516 Transcript_158124/m.503516 type:complete len:365 (+) Transcript_158124:45-1139(+)